MNTKLVAIISLSVTSFILLMSTIFFAFTAYSAQVDFEDQIDVTRNLIQGIDAMDRLDMYESEMYFNDAMTLQQEILDRNGLDSFE